MNGQSCRVRLHPAPAPAGGHLWGAEHLRRLQHVRRRVDPAGEFADYYLRFGVGFVDGRKATNLDHRRALDEGPAPDPPTLRLVRWEGYDLLSWEVDVWVWGQPPPGRLAFVCEWPARGIPETRAEIDARLVLETADRAATVWPTS